jgi:hypothetical protein
MKHPTLWGIAVLILLSGCHREISGTYLVSDKGLVCWLQIVRTPDNHLSGQISTALIGADGKIQQESAPVTGAVNAENVTISVNRFLGLQTTTLGGTLDGDKLTLSGVGGSPLVLRRADFGEYQQRLGELTAQSSQIVGAKKAAEAREQIEQRQQSVIAETERIVGRMERFDVEAEAHLKRFPDIEKHYREITQRVAKYVDRERELKSNPNAGVTRSQLSVAASQASIETEQLHNSIQSSQSTFELNIKPVAAEATSLEERCHADDSPGALIPSEVEARNAACERPLLAEATFRQRYSATATGLADLERVYLQERNTQQGLLKTAETLQ